MLQETHNSPDVAITRIDFRDKNDVARDNARFTSIYYTAHLMATAMYPSINTCVLIKRTEEKRGLPS